jgi:hypothetical protein
LRKTRKRNVSDSSGSRSGGSSGGGKAGYAVDKHARISDGGNSGSKTRAARSL